MISPKVLTQPCGWYRSSLVFYINSYVNQTVKNLTVFLHWLIVFPSIVFAKIKLFCSVFDCCFWHTLDEGYQRGAWGQWWWRGWCVCPREQDAKCRNACKYLEACTERTKVYIVLRNNLCLWKIMFCDYVCLQYLKI